MSCSSSDDEEDWSTGEVRAATSVGSTFPWAVDNKVAPDKILDIPMLQSAPPVKQYTDGTSIGNVGIKWRVKILRVYDSEEQWTGTVEIYFHWNKSNSAVAEPAAPTNERPKRRLSVSHANLAQSAENKSDGIQSSMEIIPRPQVYPIFLLLNDESSTNTEEVYFKSSKSPTTLFGYVEYHITVHERLELEVRLSIDFNSITDQYDVMMMQCVEVPI
jgi:hypothetical protein